MDFIAGSKEGFGGFYDTAFRGTGAGDGDGDACRLGSVFLGQFPPRLEENLVARVIKKIRVIL